MYNIAICDDEKGICSLIEEQLLLYAENNSLKIQTEVFYNGESLLKYLANGNRFDLYFLDIEMEHIDGIEVSRFIRDEYDDCNSEIVYVSGTTQYDRKLFDFHPLKFVSKPIRTAYIREALELAMKRKKLLMPSFDFLSNREHFSIPLQNILFFESNGRKVRVVTVNSQYTFYEKFSEIIKSLPGCFCQIHRSYIINLNAVEKYSSSNVTMKNGTEIRVGGAFKSNFCKAQIWDMNGEL